MTGPTVPRARFTMTVTDLLPDDRDETIRVLERRIAAAGEPLELIDRFARAMAPGVHDPCREHAAAILRAVARVRGALGGFTSADGGDGDGA